MDITVLLGAPGSGKGTQAQVLCQNGSFFHLSTGNLLRSAIKAGTSLGKKAQAFMDKGDLVPDSLMIELIKEQFDNLEGDTHILMDGFPRTLPQAEVLDENKATRVGRAVLFNVSEEHLIERLSGRRTCTNCGSSFHIKFVPPKRAGVCDQCGSSLVQRPDDEENVIRRRLVVYNEQIQGVLKFYKDKKKLSVISAEEPVEEVQEKLLSLLSSSNG